MLSIKAFSVKGKDTLYIGHGWTMYTSYPEKVVGNEPGQLRIPLSEIFVDNDTSYSQALARVLAFFADTYVVNWGDFSSEITATKDDLERHIADINKTHTLFIADLVFSLPKEPGQAAPWELVCKPRPNTSGMFGRAGPQPCASPDLTDLDKVLNKLHHIDDTVSKLLAAHASTVQMNNNQSNNSLFNYTGKGPEDLTGPQLLRHIPVIDLSIDLSEYATLEDFILGLSAQAGGLIAEQYAKGSSLENKLDSNQLTEWMQEVYSVLKRNPIPIPLKGSGKLGKVRFATGNPLNLPACLHEYAVNWAYTGWIIYPDVAVDQEKIAPLSWVRISCGYTNNLNRTF